MKPPYRNCWECNRQFHGNHHRIVKIADGREVAVHVSCAADMREQGRVQS